MSVSNVKTEAKGEVYNNFIQEVNPNPNFSKTKIKLSVSKLTTRSGVLFMAEYSMLKR